MGAEVRPVKDEENYCVTTGLPGDPRRTQAREDRQVTVVGLPQVAITKNLEALVVREADSVARAGPEVLAKHHVT